MFNLDHRVELLVSECARVSGRDIFGRESVDFLKVQLSSRCDDPRVTGCPGCDDNGPVGWGIVPTKIVRSRDCFKSIDGEHFTGISAGGDGGRIFYLSLAFHGRAETIFGSARPLIVGRDCGVFIAHRTFLSKLSDVLLCPDLWALLVVQTGTVRARFLSGLIVFRLKKAIKKLGKHPFVSRWPVGGLLPYRLADHAA